MGVLQSSGVSSAASSTPLILAELRSAPDRATRSARYAIALSARGQIATPRLRE
jgi:hypothetical protein